MQRERQEEEERTLPVGWLKLCNADRGRRGSKANDRPGDNNTRFCFVTSGSFDVGHFFCFDTRGHCGRSRGLTGHNRPRGRRQDLDTGALKWQRFIFMQTSSMYSCCGDNGVLSGVTSSSGRHVGGLKPMQFNQEASSCANQEVPSTDSFFTCTTERRHHQALLLVSFVQI